MRLYTDTLYPRVAASLLDEACARPVHGSRVRDLLLLHYPAALADSYTAERILDELVDSGDLMRGACEPTPSQRAWLGLQYKTHPGYIPGAKEHFVFVRKAP